MLSPRDAVPLIGDTILVAAIMDSEALPLVRFIVTVITDDEALSNFVDAKPSSFALRLFSLPMRVSVTRGYNNITLEPAPASERLQLVATDFANRISAGYAII